MGISLQYCHCQVKHCFQFSEDRVICLDGKDDHCRQECDEETAELHQAGGKEAGKDLLCGRCRQAEGKISSFTEQT